LPATLKFLALVFSFDFSLPATFLLGQAYHLHGILHTSK
jgi:hypothetical protein